MLAGVIAPDCDEKLARHHTSSEKYVWNLGNPDRYFLLFPCLVITANGNLQPPLPNKAKVNSCSDPSEMQIWVIQNCGRAG